MQKNFRELQYFFFSQNFSDALRTTTGVLLPSLILAQFGMLQIGLPISIGAFGASITDTPGPLEHRRNGILFCGLFSFLTAISTGFARANPFWMGLEIMGYSFFFSMFTIYGNRAGSVGTAALLVMVISMNENIGPDQVLLPGLLVLVGNLWYMGLSLLFSRILPYLHAQQALGECIHEVAEFMRIKAGFYSSGTRLDEDYKRAVSQQILVSEKQDGVRELLFKSRQIVKESTQSSRTLVLIFRDLVDLYEQIMTIQYDYASLQERFGETGILESITDLIKRMADELDRIGLAVQSNTRQATRLNLNIQLEELKEKIDRKGETEKEGSTLPLKKILINLRNLAQRVHDIQLNFDSKAKSSDAGRKKLEYSRFVSHQDFSLKIFRNNLTLKSSSFKHSLRVAIACVLGFIVARLFAEGSHSYWVILTIIVILKPGFSLTKQRNFQRLSGTLAGGLIGVLIILLTQDKTILFLFMVFFLLGAYSFLRTHYTLMVACITPFILLLFTYLGAGSLDILYERLVDTLIGCSIAFGANYLLFPNWESETLRLHLAGMIRANARYLEKVSESLSGQLVEEEEYKLARKSVYVHSANLSAAFHRMTTEPKNKQQNSREVHQFVVLNHILSSYIATVASFLLSTEHLAYPPDYIRLARRTLFTLQLCLKKVEPALSAPESPEKKMQDLPEAEEKTALDEDDLLLKEQLEFIRKLSEDIAKITESILEKPEASGKTKQKELTF